MNAEIDNPPKGFTKEQWDATDPEVKRWYLAVVSRSDAYADYLRRHGYGHLVSKTKSVSHLFDDNARRLRQEFRQKQFKLLQMKAESEGITNSGDRRKLVITNLNPLSAVLRLYWRVYDGDGRQYTDYQWTDIGREGGDIEEELRSTIALLQLNPIDVIDERTKKR